MTDEQEAKVLSQLNAEASPEYKEMEKHSMEWEGSKKQAEFISRQYDAVLDVLIEADAWTSHEPWKGKTAAEQVKIFIDRAKKADAAIDVLKAAYAWNDGTEGPTTVAEGISELHRRLLERANEVREYKRRLEATVKTLDIVTRHRDELVSLVERLQTDAAQSGQAREGKAPMPMPRIPIRPFPHTSGGKFDAKESVATLTETVEDLVSAVNDLQRWACE